MPQRKPGGQLQAERDLRLLGEVRRKPGPEHRVAAWEQRPELLQVAAQLHQHARLPAQNGDRRHERAHLQLPRLLPGAFDIHVPGSACSQDKQ